MARNRSALHALSIQAKFELVQGGAAVSEATQVARSAERAATSWARHADESALALRSTGARSGVDPGLLAAMHRNFRGDQAMSRDAGDRLQAARKKEAGARSALLEFRHRERALELTIEREIDKERLAQDKAQFDRADDLWMQQAWRSRA